MVGKALSEFGGCFPVGNPMVARRSTFLSALAVGVVLFAFLAVQRNDFYEFCTTRAYGYPFAWRIDNCLCDGRGGRTVYPVHAMILNPLMLVGAAFVLSRFAPMAAGKSK